MSITVKHLTKFYGEFKAIDNLAFEIQKGEVVGFLGPNGAGKTTTVRMITGFLTPSSGTIEVNGKSVAKEPYEVRKKIGYLPEENPLYPDMDVIDYLEFIARLQRVPKKEIPVRIKAVVDTFNLGDVKHMDIGQLSKGYRQRVGLAQAMIHDPEILILDEPTNGLDPNQIIDFRAFLTNLSKDKTVLLSTHALPEVQTVCSRVIIIGKGRILADSPIADLRRKYEGKEGIIIELETPSGLTTDMVRGYLSGISHVDAVAPLSFTQNGSNQMKFLIESRSNVDIRKMIFQMCVDKRITLIDLHRQHVIIEDIFHQLTRGKATP